MPCARCIMWESLAKDTAWTLVTVVYMASGPPWAVYLCLAAWAACMCESIAWTGACRVAALFGDTLARAIHENQWGRAGAILGVVWSYAIAKKILIRS